MARDPTPFYANCGERFGNGCGRKIQFRPEGTKEDGSPSFHPYDVIVDALRGADVNTETCHFVTCPRRANFGKGYCNVHRPRKPPHVHEFVAGTEFDLARGVKVSFKKCPCGVKLETGVVS